MKNKVVKRLVALGLATMASMSMAVSAFAATEGTVTVTVKNQGVTQGAPQQVEIEDIIEKAGGQGKHLYTTEPYAAYATEGVKDPTVADALIQGYNQLKGTNIAALYDPTKPYTPTVMSYNWDLKPYEGKPGIYFIYYDNKTTANESYTDNKNGTTTYKGDTWVLSVDGEESEEYASNVELEDGMEIDFDYKTQEFTYSNN